DVLRGAIYQSRAGHANAIHVVIPGEEIAARFLVPVLQMAPHGFSGATRHLAKSGRIQISPVHQRREFGAHLVPVDHRPLRDPFSAAQRIAARLTSTSPLVAAQEDPLTRIAVPPCHSVAPHQQAPSCCTLSITARVTAGSPKDTNT